MSKGSQCCHKEWMQLRLHETSNATSFISDSKLKTLKGRSAIACALSGAGRKVVQLGKIPAVDKNSRSLLAC